MAETLFDCEALAAAAKMYHPETTLSDLPWQEQVELIPNLVEQHGWFEDEDIGVFEVVAAYLPANEALFEVTHKPGPRADRPEELTLSELVEKYCSEKE